MRGKDVITKLMHPVSRLAGNIWKTGKWFNANEGCVEMFWRPNGNVWEVIETDGDLLDAIVAGDGDRSVRCGVKFNLTRI